MSAARERLPNHAPDDCNQQLLRASVPLRNDMYVCVHVCVGWGRAQETYGESVRDLEQRAKQMKVYQLCGLSAIFFAMLILPRQA